MTKLVVERLHDLATFSRSKEGDLGYDMTCVGVIYPDLAWQPVMLKLGVKLNIPPGYGMLLAARSSFPKSGWMVSNGIGIIDNGYRGEIMASVVPFTVSAPDPSVLIGTRVVQAVPINLHSFDVEWGKVDEDTDRGGGGFGSTN